LWFWHIIIIVIIIYIVFGNNLVCTKRKKERVLSPFGYSVSDSQDSYLGRSFGGVSEDEVVYRCAKQPEGPGAYQDNGGIYDYRSDTLVHSERHISIVVVAFDRQGLDVYKLDRLDLEGGRGVRRDCNLIEKLVGICLEGSGLGYCRATRCTKG